MTHTTRGDAPKDHGSCSHADIPQGRSAGFSWMVVAALVVCLGLAACSSSQGVSGQTPARSAQSGPRITVDMVTHGQAFDPFWALVKKGAQTAATDFNVNLVYRWRDHRPGHDVRIHRGADHGGRRRQVLTLTQSVANTASCVILAFTADRTGGTIQEEQGHVATSNPRVSGMTNTSRGSAPKHDGNSSRNGVLPGRRAGFSRGVAVLAVAACVALAACSSSQGVSGQTPARSAQSGPRITVAMVTHGQAFDPFWALVKKGAQTAATDFNVNLVYSSPSTTNPQEQASLITKAAAQHPKGLVVTIPDAAVLSGPIKQAVSAGIPVIVMNVGADVFQNVGGLTFVGQDETAAGAEAAREMADAGVHKALCVIHEEQNIALVQRCAGFAKALAARGGSVTTIHVNGAS